MAKKKAEAPPLRLSDEQQRKAEYGIPLDAVLRSTESEAPYSRHIYEAEDAFHWLIRERRAVVKSGSVKKGDDLVGARARCTDDMNAALEKATA